MIDQLIESNELSSRSINRKKDKYEYITIKPSRKDEYLEQGWEIVASKLSKSIRLKKCKKHNQEFEDRVWALFAKMKFDYINASNQFKLEYQPGLTKQIDVFAGDDESIIFVECKSTEFRQKVSYQKDINELIGIKEKLREKAQRLFPGKQKVAFIFATNNGILSDADKLRLTSESIFHFTQDDIEYFEQLSELLGHAAKYQLFGKLFSGMKIPELENRVPAIKGKVSSGYTFYSFIVDPKYLLKIGYILHRNDTNIESANAYQRLIKKSRLKSIGKYIDNGGYFPNSIIININVKKGRGLKFENSSQIDHDSSTTFGVLHLPKLYKSAFIIDGQHRLYGYSKSTSESNHSIPVVAFLNLPPEEQTRIFVDINHTQKSVPANLLHSIMSDFHWNSKNQRAAISALKTRLFNVLNSDDSSPFYKRMIMSEEKKTDQRCLTLQTIKSWGLNKVELFGKLKGDKLIKTGYLTDTSNEKTLLKAKDFFNTIFGEIQTKLEEQWALGSAQGGFIAMNIGVSSIIRLSDSIISHSVKFNGLKPEELSGIELGKKVIPFLEPVVEFVLDLDFEGLKKLRSLFGSGATEKVLREFQNEIKSSHSSFNPPGLEEWIKDNSGEFNKSAYDIGNGHIEIWIDMYIKKKLKNEFGDRWWIDGVPKKIQKKCSDNRIDQGSSEHESRFLTTIDYYEIINSKWSIFKDNLTPPGMETKNKVNRIEWLKKFNSIRQKYSHPQRENVSEKEYELLVKIKNWLEKSIVPSIEK